VKIYIADHLGAHKTTQTMERWFEKHGHEVHYDYYYNPAQMEWCDVAFFAWAESMAGMAVNTGWGGSKVGEKITHQFTQEYSADFVIKKKPIFVWAVDIEIWNRDFNCIKDYSQLEGLFYMSKAYFDYMQKEAGVENVSKCKQIMKLPISLDMNEWSFRQHSAGKSLVCVGEQWMAKNPYFITQLMAMLPNDYTMTVLGKWNEGVWRWTEEQFWYEVRSYGLEGRVKNIKEIPWGSSEPMNQFLDDKDYLITFSAKDAFSIPVAEAMAKGIKAFPHDFMGSQDIWGKYVWKTLPELVDRIQNEPYNSEEYRQYIQDNYSTDVVLTKLEEIFKDATQGNK